MRNSNPTGMLEPKNNKRTSSPKRLALLLERANGNASRDMIAQNESRPAGSSIRAHVKRINGRTCGGEKLATSHRALTKRKRRQARLTTHCDEAGSV
jgi:hypothetical protein